MGLINWGNKHAMMRLEHMTSHQPFFLKDKIYIMLSNIKDQTHIPILGT